MRKHRQSVRTHPPRLPLLSLVSVAYSTSRYRLRTVRSVEAQWASRTSRLGFHGVYRSQGVSGSSSIPFHGKRRVKSLVGCATVLSVGSCLARIVKGQRLLPMIFRRACLRTAWPLGYHLCHPLTRTKDQITQPLVASTSIYDVCRSGLPNPQRHSRVPFYSQLLHHSRTQVHPNP